MYNGVEITRDCIIHKKREQSFPPLAEPIATFCLSKTKLIPSKVELFFPLPMDVVIYILDMLVCKGGYRSILFLCKSAYENFIRKKK